MIKNNRWTYSLNLVTKGFKNRSIQKYPDFWSRTAYNHNGGGDPHYMDKLLKYYNNTQTPKPENYVEK